MQSSKEKKSTNGNEISKTKRKRIETTSGSSNDIAAMYAAAQASKMQRREQPKTIASPLSLKMTSSTDFYFEDTLKSNMFNGPSIQPCRSVNNYEKLNLIDEGSYGIVYRARDKVTGEIVALKKLKLNVEQNGFPVTSLREIYSLLWTKHPNIVDVKEIVTTPNRKGIFIVMEFVEHDLKSLMDSMPNPFLQSEIKTLMMQLLSAVACLHESWLIHRDLKTSNLLMNNCGQMKVADFGLARKFGSPMGDMTPLVVTLWYRAPELLLGAKEYSTAIDVWSIGCIFAELLNKEPLFPGKGEIDQLSKIFQLLGKPTEKNWPGYSELPSAKSFTFASQLNNRIRSRFPYLTENGLDLLSRLLAYDPKTRISAQEALRHPYFTDSPAPQDPSLFPTFPSKGAGERKKRFASPSLNARRESSPIAEVMDEEQLRSALNAYTNQGGGFRLKY